MPNNMFRQGVQELLNPALMQGLQGNLVPGTPQDVTAVGNILGNILQGNLGITKQDQTGSFQFDPYKGGFSLNTPGGWGVSAYANDPTIEGRFRFGAQPAPISNRISIEGLPTNDENIQQTSAARKFLNEYITPKISADAARYYY